MELEESVSEDVGVDLNEGFDTFIEKKGMLVSQILQPWIGITRFLFEKYWKFYLYICIYFWVEIELSKMKRS